jgi:hypothetical protein
MKNLFSIAFVAMLFVQSAKAQEVAEIQNPTVIATPAYFAKFESGDNEFKMRVLLSKRDGDQSALILVLKDKDGNPLFRTFLNKAQNQGMVKLNLEELADGKYVFELSNKYGTTQKTYLKESTKPVLSNVKQLIALN